MSDLCLWYLRLQLVQPSTRRQLNSACTWFLSVRSCRYGSASAHAVCTDPCVCKVDSVLVYRSALPNPLLSASQREDVVQAELLASPKPGEPAVVLTHASLSWEAGRLQKTVLHDVSLQVLQQGRPCS